MGCMIENEWAIAYPDRLMETLPIMEPVTVKVMLGSLWRSPR